MDFNNEYEKLTEKKTVFYLMSDDTIEFHNYAMNFFSVARPAHAKGCLYEEKCQNCRENIKIYSLEEVKKTYSQVDIGKIKKEYEGKDQIILNKKEFDKNNKIECYTCKNEIILEEDFDPETELELNCMVYSAECSCGGKYTCYILRPQKDEYTQRKAIKKIKSLTEKNSLVYAIGEYEKLNEITCPCCGYSLKKKTSKMFKSYTDNDSLRNFMSKVLPGDDYVSARDARDKNIGN